MIVPLILGFLFGLALGWTVMVVRRKLRSRRNYLAAIEFWVYLPSETPPSQDDLMRRLLKDNPTPAIGPAEGILFSDIRLHISLVLRSKNPHAFRPDLVNDHLEPTADTLAAIGRSPAFLKVRYVSEETLPDARHVQFLTHLALAAAELAGAEVVCDVVAEKLVSVEDLRAALDQDRDATRADLQLQIVWENDPVGGHAETRGLLKVGLPELRTDPSDSDQRVLVQSVLEEAAKSLWSSRSIGETLDVRAYDDTFRLLFSPVRNGPYRTRIMRVQQP